MAGKRYLLDNRRGLLKKSFSLYYNGGVIWIEHLDALHEEDVLPKLMQDIREIRRPSTSSFVAVNLDETPVRIDTFAAVIHILNGLSRPLQKVVFVGISSKLKRYVKKQRGSIRFAFSCIDDFEAAKEWLLFGK